MLCLNQTSSVKSQPLNTSLWNLTSQRYSFKKKYVIILIFLVLSLYMVIDSIEVLGLKKIIVRNVFKTIFKTTSNKNLKSNNGTNEMTHQNDETEKAIENKLETQPQSREKQNIKKTQRICILAGPHKTGSTSIQENFRNWYNISLSHPLHNNWVWPNQGGKAEYYQIISGLIQNKINNKIKIEYGTLENGLQKRRNEIEKQWKNGYNIVFGSEVLDVASVKGDETFFERFSSKLLPEDVLDEQINVVVMYRTPKIKHLISLWHENFKHLEWRNQKKNNFARFCTGKEYSPLYGLELVRKLLQETNWNVDLVPLEPLVEHGWETSSFVACQILKVKCDEKKPVNVTSPKVLNVYDKNNPKFKSAGNEKRIVPNVPNQTLTEIDRILNIFDCNYLHLVTDKNKRLKIHFSEWLQKRMKNCQGNRVMNFTQASKQAKSQLEKAVENYLD